MVSIAETINVKLAIFVTIYEKTQMNDERIAFKQDTSCTLTKSVSVSNEACDNVTERISI